MIITCPVCEGQGNIYRAKVLDLGIEIKICDECEACWTQNKVVDIQNFKGLTPFLKENGLTYENARIEDLEYLEVTEPQKMILACPRCEINGGQGAVYRARIIDLSIELSICDECESCWTKDQSIDVNDFERLTQFLEEHGLTYENAKMEDLGYIEAKKS